MTAPESLASVQMKPEDLARLLAGEVAAIAQGWHTPVMIWGPPGIGKSEIVAQTARDHDLPLIDLRLSQLEPSDLRGIPYRVGTTVEWAPPATLPQEERHGPRGILFLDELTAALPTVAAAAYQLVLDRRLGDYRLPEGWLIIAAGNRVGDRGVAYAMPAPLANRFQHVWLRADVEQWLRWAERVGIDPRIRQFLRSHPQWLTDFDPMAEPMAFATPRSWVFADRVLKKSGGVAIDQLFLQLAGCVGPKAAEAFVRAQRLDNALLERIWSEPAAAAVLNSEHQWALFEQLSQRLNDGQLHTSQALAIARYLPDAAVALAVVKLLRERLGEDLYRDPAFSEFSAARAAELVDVASD